VSLTPFDNFASTLISPLDEIIAVAPGAFDAPILNPAGNAVVSRAVYVGVSGDLAVLTKNGTTVTIPALAAGVWHAIRISQIITAGTAATGILVGY
jgi:hypothetical protein